MKSSLCTTEPVSTSTGSSAWITKALMARLPKPLTALVDVTTSTSGAAWYVCMHENSSVSRAMRKRGASRA